MRRWALPCAAAIALTAAGSALADHWPAPWDGGDAATTPQETAFAVPAAAISGRSEVVVHCNDDEAWTAKVAANGWTTRPSGFARLVTGPIDLAPEVCERLETLVHLRPSSPCSSVEYRTVQKKVRMRVRVKRNGGWVRVWRTRTVPKIVKVPKDVPCDQDDELVWAVWVLAHEAVHVRGVADEAVTDCQALQRIAAAAVALGANERYGAEMAAKAWEDYRYDRHHTPEYFTPDCHEDGPLDLSPNDGRWP